MNSLEHFNRQYELEKSPKGAPPSLKDFFNKVVYPRLGSDELFVLDLGAGSKSIFEDLPLSKNNITAIDFSEVAINRARLNFKEINYQIKNVAEEGIFKKNYFDLIFDSHCLHCLTEVQDRAIAFTNIRDALKEDGIFCAEMMVQPVGKTVYLPYKYIPTALELESELLSHGFKITYFMIERNFVFYNDSGECDLLRVVVKK